ncbi:DsbA family protein [Patescibacteria group bacterium]
MEKRNTGLIITILFGALIISASLVFFGFKMNTKMTDEEFNTKVREGIEIYVEDMKQEYEADAEAQQQPKPTTVEGDYSDDDPFKGDENAPITIVEFSDYQCPFCSRFAAGTLKEIDEKYIQTGKVKFVFRDLPLDGHTQAYPASLFAECAREQAGDEVYFKVHDELFATVGTGESFDFDKIADFAVELGVDKAKAKTCFDEDKYKEEIEADRDEARSIGISGTPAFIVGNEIISGAQPFSAFESVIEAQLNQ